MLKLLALLLLAAGGVAVYAAQTIGKPIVAANVESRSAQLCQFYAIGAQVGRRLEAGARMPAPETCSCVASTLLRTSGPGKTAEILEALRVKLLERFKLDGLPGVEAAPRPTNRQMRDLLEANEYVLANVARNCVK